VLYREPYLTRGRLLHLAMILRAKSKRLWQRPNQSFFQNLKICNTVKKAINGRIKWQIHLVVH